MYGGVVSGKARSSITRSDVGGRAVRLRGRLNRGSICQDLPKFVSGISIYGLFSKFIQQFLGQIPPIWMNFENRPHMEIPETNMGRS